MVEEFTDDDWEQLLPQSVVPSRGARAVRYVIAFAALCLGSTAIVIDRPSVAALESSVPALLSLYVGLTVLTAACWWAESRID